MKKNGIVLLDTTELKEHNKKVIGVKYNKVTTGPHKGLFEAIPIVGQDGVPVSTWTKDQEAYLDKRFLPLERDVKELKSDMKEVKSRLSSLETGMKEVKSRLSSLETGMKEVLRILKQK